MKYILSILLFLSFAARSQTTITLTSSSNINSGTLNQLGYYAAAGRTISGLTLGTNLSITGTTLNAASGATPTLSQVLTAGNTATNSIILSGGVFEATGSAGFAAKIGMADGAPQITLTKGGFDYIIATATPTAIRQADFPNYSGIVALHPTIVGQAGKVLAVNSGATALEWITASGGSGANPTASIGLTAVNGVATTFMRSDAAPALSQAIAPTWTGTHSFQKNAIAATSTDAVVLQNLTAAAAAAQQHSPRIRWVGQGWKTDATAASIQTEWWAENRPVQGAAAPTSNLVFTSKIGAAAAVDVMTLSESAATFTMEGIFKATTGNVFEAQRTAGGTTNWVRWTTAGGPNTGLYWWYVGQNSAYDLLFRSYDGTFRETLLLGGTGSMNLALGQLTISTAFTPATATDATHPNRTITFDDNFIYVRTSTGTWKKIALTAF